MSRAVSAPTWRMLSATSSRRSGRCLLASICAKRLSSVFSPMPLRASSSSRRSVQGVDVGDAADEAELREAGRELLAEALDVHRAARGEVLDGARDARRAAQVRAAGARSVRDDGRLADRAALRRLERAQLVLAALAGGEDGADDLRDHLARSLHDHVVADQQALRLHLLRVVQRRHAHARPADHHRLEDRERRQRARAADRDLDVAQPRHRLLGRELVRRRPARLPPDNPELPLLADVVDLHDHAVDGVRQLVAASHPRFAERDGVVDALEAPCVRVSREAGRAQPFEGAPTGSRAARRPRSSRAGTRTAGGGAAP